MQKVKTKVRFTSLDVAAMVQNLQRYIGMRATNIYDLNPSTYLIKLAKSQQKALLLIENGVRFHTVEDKADKKQIPSGFTMKFRKFLRSKRLESVRQVGVERVVVFTFGTESYTNHLILQLYAQGNIILTDNDYRILQSIRSHEYNDKVKTAVGQIYPFEYAANIYFQNIDISIPKIQQVLAQMTEKTQTDNNEAQNKKKKKNNQKKQGTKLRDVVFKLIPCLFPAVIDNILIGEKIDPDLSVGLDTIKQIQQACKINYKFLKQFLKLKHAGYLYSKKQIADKQDKQYFEYSPYQNIKFKQSHAQFKFDNFDTAVAEYYSKYKKSQHQQQQQFQQLAWKKYEQIKKDQQSRVKKLQEEQDIYKVKAEYIQKNIHDVEAIIKIIKTMEDNGYSWQAIQRMVLQSKKNGDPLANIIHQLNINKRQVTVLLGDQSSEQQHFDLLPVQINIDYNAYTNATLYYENKKRNYQKELRTKEASQQVLKIAEKDALKIIQRKKNQHFSKNIPTRKQFWFQKFYWFISSEGVLVISGRDSHQNQLIVKRYMKPGDLYMHSDYGGAASTVIKINSKQHGVPRTTLQQAAISTVCRSKAWDTKILSGAWWVFHDQVSKSAPTGQFLPTGSFMIRGKRNYIQPNRMQMGLTFLFKIDQQSAKRHQNDRKIHQQEQKQQKKLTYNQNAQNDSQQFAIISVETAPKQKVNKNQKGNKQPNQPQLKKQESNKQAIKEQVESQKQQNQDSDQSSDEDSQKQIQKLKQGKTQSKANEKKKNQDQQPKQKMRNKRKLKKLQKYLQEQDQEQRQIIMKMLGAKQMKHRLQSEQIEAEEKGKKKNKQKKKGIDKYIGNLKHKQNEQKPDPNKVLFFKKKQDQKDSDDSIPDEPKNNNVDKLQNDKLQQQKQVKQLNHEEKQEKQQQQAKQENQGEEDQNQQQDQEEEQANQNNEKKQEQKKKQEEQQVDEKAIDSQIAQLFKLVGKNHPEDKIENLVAMCAPYNSIKDNRFKIKLVPGGLKKGKASRNILHFFLNSGQLNQIQKPLVKSIPEQEIINCIIGNVKLAGAGLLKLQQKEKADKKIKRKQNDKKEKNG